MKSELQIETTEYSALDADRFSEEGDHDKAIAIYKELVKNDRNNADYLHNLGSEYLILEKEDFAEKYFIRTLVIEPNKPQTLYNLGLIYLRKQEATKALKHFELAEEHGFDQLSNLYFYQAKALRVLGKFDQAEKVYNQVKHAGREIDALMGMANVKKIRDKNDPIFEILESHSSKQQCGADIFFTLAKIYSDTKQYDKAFNNYEKANSIIFKDLKDNTKIFTRNIIGIKEVFSRDLIEQFKGQGNKSEVPIFVVGTPRSGTTLTEQIISSHSKVYGAGETKYMSKICKNSHELIQAKSVMPYPYNVTLMNAKDLNMLGQRYLKNVNKTNSGKLPRVTDKMPANFVHLGMISIMFPNAKIIHCRRHPLDACLSMFFQNFSDVRSYQFNLNSMCEYYRGYVGLMKHWYSVLPGKIYDVFYENTVDNFDAVSRDLIKNCNLEWEDQCLEFYKTERSVHTASQWQVRQPIYKTSQFKWKKYEKHLAPYKESLQDIIDDYEKELAACKNNYAS